MTTKHSALEQNRKKYKPKQEAKPKLKLNQTKSIARINKDIKFIKTIFHIYKQLSRDGKAI